MMYFIPPLQVLGSLSWIFKSFSDATATAVATHKIAIFK